MSTLYDKQNSAHLNQQIRDISTRIQVLESKRRSLESEANALTREVNQLESQDKETRTKMKGLRDGRGGEGLEEQVLDDEHSALEAEKKLIQDEETEVTDEKKAIADMLKRLQVKESLVRKKQSDHALKERAFEEKKRKLFTLVAQKKTFDSRKDERKQKLVRLEKEMAQIDIDVRKESEKRESLTTAMRHATGLRKARESI